MITAAKKNKWINALLFILAFLALTTCTIYGFPALSHLYHHTDAMIYLNLIFTVLILVISQFYHTFPIPSGSLWLPFWICWELCFTMIILTRLIHPIPDYLMFWGFLGATGIPLLYLAWSSKDHTDHLVMLVAKAAAWNCVLFFILHIILLPLIDSEPLVDPAVYQLSRFYGLSSNPNNIGLLSLAYFTGALYAAIFSEKRNMLYSGICGIALGFLLLSQSRTSMMGIIAEVIVIIPCLLRLRDSGTPAFTIFSAGNTDRSRIRRPLFALALFVTMTAGSMALLSYEASILRHPVEESTILDRFAQIGTAGEAVGSDGQEVEEPLLDPVLNRILSGRGVTWAVFYHNLKPFGQVKPPGGVTWRGIQKDYAHNNILEITYQCGYIAGILYTLWIICTLVFLGRCIFQKGFCTRKAQIYAAIVIAGFFPVAMLEIFMDSVSDAIAFMLLFALIPIGRKS